jgi:hypothetical protein
MAECCVAKGALGGTRAGVARGRGREAGFLNLLSALPPLLYPHPTLHRTTPHPFLTLLPRPLRSPPHTPMK